MRTVDEEIEIHEEIFSLISFHENVKGDTIFEAVNDELFSFADKEKLVSVCTDGAHVMAGRNEGFAGHLLQHNFNIYLFHCIIHQQALFTNNLNMSETMEIVTKIINKIRGGNNALNHRKFKSFMEEINAEYGDLILFTEVRWLSKGRCLERLYNLRNDVILFFEKNPSYETNGLINVLKDFLLEFSFLEYFDR